MGRLTKGLIKGCMITIPKLTDKQLRALTNLDSYFGNYHTSQSLSEFIGRSVLKYEDLSKLEAIKVINSFIMMIEASENVIEFEREWDLFNINYWVDYDRK